MSGWGALSNPLTHQPLFQSTSQLGTPRGHVGFPGDHSGKEPTCRCRRHKRRVWSLGREDPLEEDVQPTPVFLPGESQGERSLAGCSPRHHTESDTTEVTENTPTQQPCTLLHVEHNKIWLPSLMQRLEPLIFFLFKKMFSLNSPSYSFMIKWG